MLDLSFERLASACLAIFQINVQVSLGDWNMRVDFSSKTIVLTVASRTESVNFVHDVNVLRQTLKSVYATSADLQALNGEIGKSEKNCRVQVLVGTGGQSLFSFQTDSCYCHKILQSPQTYS